MRDRIQTATQFLKDRTGFHTDLERVFSSQVAGGARWAHVFGAALGVLFAVELATGLVLSFTYSASTWGAWASVFEIQHRTRAGWFVRGMHAYCADAMLVVLGMHLLQVMIYGAYKKPREVTWWIGLALMGVITGSVISGYRLPWDQRTFWALKVEMNIAAALPVVGPTLHTVIAGGGNLGQLTLTRLYAAHAILLPAIAIGLLGLKGLLVRRHGRTPPPGADVSKSDPVFPFQVFKDLAFTVVVLIVVCVVTVVTGGAPLDAPADPNHYYPARPEWFLMPLFKLRMMVPPAMETWVTGVLPAVLAAGMFAVPLLDRHQDRTWGSRRSITIFVVAGAALVGLLIGLAYWEDANDAEHSAEMQEAERRATRSKELAVKGIPPEGPLRMLKEDPLTRGRDVYRQYCISCHRLDGEGEQKAPDHDGFASSKWVDELLRRPQANHYFAHAEHDEHMTSQTRLGDEALKQITGFLVALSRDAKPPAQSPTDGEILFRKKCMTCHTYEDDGDILGTGGPDLTGWGSAKWIMTQIKEPKTIYGELAKMPAFADQLSEHDVQIVTEFLLLQRQ